MQDRSRFSERLHRCPDIASVDFPMIDKKRKLIPRVIIRKKAVIWLVRREPVKLPGHRSGHIGRNKEVAIVGERELMQVVRRMRQARRDIMIGKNDLTCLLGGKPGGT